ncbi:hypothetical protein E7811_14035 [Aliigemmobacter aestuarii]|uniref:Nickel/cobalt efflux system n=2 Tax=Aliigemmobacter aestuarii TaxID=1445661 RepID=A0A4S3MKU5_9RHOB|nr:hypothetical protein E7811_14035 [Gemmobacter aestuarii]
MRGLLLAGLAVALVLGTVWALGLTAPLSSWVADSQRSVQNQMAGAVRAIRAGDPGAVLALLAVAFGYGFFHAAGPGHGKMLIGGYGMARRVALGRLAAIALLSSLAQAAVAVALVYGFIALLGWTRQHVEGMAETVLDPVGTLAILGIGLWLVWRGGRGISRQVAAHDAAHHHPPHPEPANHHHAHHHHDHGHDHDDDHNEPCGCGHAHAPTLVEVERATDLRAVLALIAGIAIRPCSGALFLLILTWKMGIAGAGILGTFAMGLGTATVTVAVAAMAVWAREGALAALPGRSVARALPVLELAVGAVVALVAARMLMTAI